MDFNIPATPTDILNMVNDNIGHMVLDHFQHSAPTITNKEAVLNFSESNIIDNIYYILMHKPDNISLQIEHDISYITLSTFLLADEIPELNTDLSIDYDDLLKPFFILNNWAEISFLLTEHKSIFAERFPSKNYYFSNRYINNLELILNNLAIKIANKLNETLEDLKSPITAESVLNNNVYQRPEVMEFMYLKKELEPICNYKAA